MEKDLMKNGYYRLNNLLMGIINCTDKQEIIRLSNIIIDDIQEFVALIYVENEIGDEDLEEFKQGLIDVEKEAMAELNDGEDAVEDDVTAVEEEEPAPADSPADGQ